MADSVIDDIRSFYGGDARVSDWLVVEQSLIDKFGEATCDSDWMHTDPERARRDGPFGGTVAFGFWTVSMMTYFARQTMGSDYPAGALYGLNYGFDRVRLMAPVPVGSRIRNHMRLVDVEDRGGGRYLVKTSNSIEVEGVEKPAMVAEWLFLLVWGGSAS
ncbi:MAG: MaoC family dehydratase [Planctomycetaceae bacterium]